MKPIKLNKKLVLNVDKLAILDEEALSSIKGGSGADAAYDSCGLLSNGCVSCNNTTTKPATEV